MPKRISKTREALWALEDAAYDYYAAPAGRGPEYGDLMDLARASALANTRATPKLCDAAEARGRRDADRYLEGM